MSEADFGYGRPPLPIRSSRRWSARRAIRRPVLTRTKSWNSGPSASRMAAAGRTSRPDSSSPPTSRRWRLRPSGGYATLNPLNPDLLARRANRIAWANEGELAKDKDVLARRWVLVDADPVRDPLVSATDAEKAEARAVILDVREHLVGRGWPVPVFADSGNGYHLLYRVDLPAEDGGEVRKLLNALADKFDTPRVKIDRSVFNPARICKLPGTLARKGDHAPARPHRRATVLEGPTP